MANTLVRPGMGKEIAGMAVLAVARRSGHGGADWSLPTDTGRLRQPQDGAPESKTKLTAFRVRPVIGVFQEPEDAALTGDTRSLTRRLLGLNVMAIRRAPLVVCGAIVQTRVA